MKASFARTDTGSYMRKVMIALARAKRENEHRITLRHISEQGRAEKKTKHRMKRTKRHKAKVCRKKKAKVLVHPAYDVFMQWKDQREEEELKRSAMQYFVAVAGEEETEVKRQAKIDFFLSVFVGETSRQEMMDYFCQLPKPEYWIDFETEEEEDQ